jgi:YHS domain-containing protein
MSFLSRIIRFLFWVLVLSWGVGLLRRAVSWVLHGSIPASPQSAEAQDDTQAVATARRLVRDPICGVHVAEALSIPLRDAGEVLHFCSMACRDQYIAGTKKLAANG